MITLYGTPTSPYVRRVRVLARELGVEVALRNTNDAGVQDELVTICPTWKIPTARLADGRVLWDSAIINDRLIADTYGVLVDDDGVLSAPDEAMRLRIAVIDAGLDAAIALFYMKRDGVDLGAPYLQKQRARIDAAMGWVVGDLEAGSFGHRVGLDVIALVTTLEWFQLRGTWPVEHRALLQQLAWWGDRASFRETRP